ncbi:hypothetical protein EPO15_05900 [bacterium]|nr:MAG: hypothetical protein EPO15_05900 [bacterium]
MKRRLLRLFCMLTLGLVLFDAAADSVGCHESGASCAVVCHGGSCCTYLAAPGFPPLAVVSRPAVYTPSEAESYALLLPRPHFRPPRLAA